MPFVLANGEQVTRSIGFAIIRIGGHFTIDEVVFAQKGDLLLLGARTLERLNLVDETRCAVGNALRGVPGSGIAAFI